MSAGVRWRVSIRRTVLAGQILPQRAAQRRRHRLYAPAYAQHGHEPRGSQAHQAHFKTVAQGIDLAQRLHGRLAEEGGGHIVAAAISRPSRRARQSSSISPSMSGLSSTGTPPAAITARQIVPKDEMTCFLRVDAARYADERICRHADRRLSMKNVTFAPGERFKAQDLFPCLHERRCAGVANETVRMKKARGAHPARRRREKA